MLCQGTAWAILVSSLSMTVAGWAAPAESSARPGIVRELQQEVREAANANDVAAQRFIEHLDALISESIVPGIRRGIIARSTIRPPALAVEVTDDPSPYHLGVRVDADGTLRVRLSLGYVAMHDTALDAVALSAVLGTPEQLSDYLAYQLALARANERRQANSERRYRAMNFAQFAHLDSKATEALYSQDFFQHERARVEVNSLGWVVAYLLARSDSRLTGVSSSTPVRDGRAAAMLAGASGWFPVPPVATALGLAEVARAASNQDVERSRLCRAASLIEQGARVLKVIRPWRSRLKRDPDLQRQVGAIESDVARMRRGGDCTSSDTAVL